MATVPLASAPVILTRVQNILNINSPFGLETLDGFPHSDYLSQIGKYSTLSSWFDGSALDDETESKGGKKVSKYPVKINPIPGSCMKHAWALFGEIPDNNFDSLVRPKIVVPKEQRDLARRMEETISTVWFESNGAAIQMENAVLSQIYGGCVFKIPWFAPEDKFRTYNIGIERVLPTEFIGIPANGNPWCLQEAWIVRSISPETAILFGATGVREDGRYYYIEHWTPGTFKITINDEVLSYQDRGIVFQREGSHEFGTVPIVYIPHVRSGSFYGDSLITAAAQGIVREMNLRVADIGDAVNDESHGMIVGRNIHGAPSVKKTTYTDYLDIGGTPGLTNNESEPDMFSISRSKVTTGMTTFSEDLMKHYRREVFVPAVADGEDEGSQRSALTLTTRMWPLVGHTHIERINWSTGLSIINKLILRILNIKKVGNVPEEALTMRLTSKWYPTLPRDRTEVVDEAVNRASQNLGSPQSLMELLGDIEDIDEVMNQIIEWQKILAKTQAEVQAAVFQQSQSAQGNNQNNAAKTQKAQDKG